MRFMILRCRTYLTAEYQRIKYTLAGYKVSQVEKHWIWYKLGYRYFIKIYGYDKQED